ncbi:hypothetical protein CWT12_12310 [Actinomyces sp. 432]|uniref:HNH endonuclease n=1 Tax=Actinomyces sp. 432 TaxID=2057798 RepID=UPI001373AC51|nr:hypothetical protein CWT12_12310 [Actinomyces sp. 432]
MGQPIPTPTAPMNPAQPGRLRRDSRTWRRIAAQVRARDQDKPCGICGQPINWNTRNPNAGDAPSVDHIKPWATHPELRLDPANLMVVHQDCNRAKGVKRAALPSIGNQSRNWGAPRKRSLTQPHAANEHS